MWIDATSTNNQLVGNKYLKMLRSLCASIFCLKNVSEKFMTAEWMLTNQKFAVQL